MLNISKEKEDMQPTPHTGADRFRWLCPERIPMYTTRSMLSSVRVGERDVCDGGMNEGFSWKKPKQILAAIRQIKWIQS